MLTATTILEQRIGGETLRPQRLVTNKCIFIPKFISHNQ